MKIFLLNTDLHATHSFELREPNMAKNREKFSSGSILQGERGGEGGKGRERDWKGRKERKREKVCTQGISARQNKRERERERGSK